MLKTFARRTTVMLVQTALKNHMGLRAQYNIKLTSSLTCSLCVRLGGKIDIGEDKVKGFVLTIHCSVTLLRFSFLPPRLPTTTTLLQMNPVFLLA